MRITEICALVRRTAEVRGIDPRIWAALVWQESRGKPWAYRYEPGFYSRYISDRPKSDLGGVWPRVITEESERVFRATSFGLCQIMGQVAREQGFEREHLASLFDPKMNLEIGSKFFSALLEKWEGVPTREQYKEALRRWNGRAPGDYTYSMQVLEHVATGRYRNILCDESE